MEPWDVRYFCFFATRNCSEHCGPCSPDLTLGTCGSIVYLRAWVFEFLGIDRWNWTANGYFESVTFAIK